MLSGKRLRAFKAKQNEIKKRVAEAERINPNYKVRIGSIVETPMGIGRVSYIRHDANTQLPTQVKVRIDQYNPKFHNINSIKYKPRG